MNILIFARHFPPDVSGGARRPYLLTKGLSELGATVRVVAPTLPDGVAGLVVPHPASDPPTSARKTDHWSLRDWARKTFLLPDPDIRWSLRAAGAAEAMTDFSPDVVISTSPPESLHFAASRYARRNGTKWIADLRDNWLESPLLPVRNRLARKRVERWLASQLLKRADLIIAPTQIILDEAARLAPGRPLKLIPQAVPDMRTPSGDKAGGANTFSILHTGSFTLSHASRHIKPALDFFEAVHERDSRFRLKLVGRLTEDEKREARRIDGVECQGVLSLEETWQAQADADMLLLVAAPGTEAEPGKLAEYRAAGKPIICLGGGKWRATIPGADEDPVEWTLEQRSNLEQPLQNSSELPSAQNVSAVLLSIAAKL